MFRTFLESCPRPCVTHTRVTIDDGDNYDNDDEDDADEDGTLIGPFR